MRAEPVRVAYQANLQFTIAPESNYPEIRKKKVLEAVDGGVSTFKYGYALTQGINLWLT